MTVLRERAGRFRVAQERYLLARRGASPLLERSPVRRSCDTRALGCLSPAYAVSRRRGAVPPLRAQPPTPRVGPLASAVPAAAREQSARPRTRRAPSLPGAPRQPRSLGSSDRSARAAGEGLPPTRSTPPAIHSPPRPRYHLSRW